MFKPTITLTRDGSQPFATMAGTDDYLPLVNTAPHAASIEAQKSVRAIPRQNNSVMRFAVLQSLRTAYSSPLRTAYY